MKVHVFESEPWITSAWQTRETNLDCIWVQGLLTADMAPRFKGAQIISSDVSVLDKVTLQKFDRLKLIALRSTGTDQVDLDYCKANQIIVCHLPAYAQYAVAEHVFALLQHPNVLVTPHCAFFTREAAGRLIEMTISNIESFISGKTKNVVPRNTR